MPDLPIPTSLTGARQSGAPELEPAAGPESTSDPIVRSACRTFLLLLIVVVLPISFLVPPFQSPDEFNHIKRAYLLSKGDVFL